jgi:hypothetical protein
MVDQVPACVAACVAWAPASVAVWTSMAFSRFLDLLGAIRRRARLGCEFRSEAGLAVLVALRYLPSDPAEAPETRGLSKHLLA